MKSFNKHFVHGVIVETTVDTYYLAELNYYHFLKK